MTDDERAIVRKIYDLQIQLIVQVQSDELAALRQSTTTLQRSHELIGELLTLLAKLAGYEKP